MLTFMPYVYVPLCIITSLNYKVTQILSLRIPDCHSELCTNSLYQKKNNRVYLQRQNGLTSQKITTTSISYISHVRTFPFTNKKKKINKQKIQFSSLLTQTTNIHTHTAHTIRVQHNSNKLCMRKQLHNYDTNYTLQIFVATKHSTEQHIDDNKNKISIRNV